MKGMLLHRYRQVRRLGMGTAVRLVWSRGTRVAGGALRRLLGRLRPTGLGAMEREAPPRRLAPPLALAVTGAELAWMEHRFDLLGSGLVDVALRSSEPLADLPRAWRGRARQLVTELPIGYRLIDWQRDAKSGYRWSAQTWHSHVQYGQAAGVDVKWPWELSRLQHLPALAGRIAIAEPALRSRLVTEMRAQITDFVLQNPPNYGVNWVCAMDVGIRAANIVLAVDLARAAGETLPQDFLRMVSATLRDHGRFIERNLEWGASLCSNHYLADVVGLLFIAAYLEPDEESRSWLVFSGREVVLQLKGQFHAAGTNFEASTCYHRLSSDMMVFAAAMVLHLCDRHPDEIEGWWIGPVPELHPPPAAPTAPSGASATGVRVPFDAEAATRLWGMGIFTQAIVRRDGTIPIIGDDDSGRFMRFHYAMDSVADLRSHTELPAQVAALFAAGVPSDAVSRWLRAWVGGAALRRPSDQTRPDPGAAALRFDDFGLFVWNRGGFRVVFRCGPVGQNGNGGHAHSDQLAFCLDWNGRAMFIDSGTGLYTPDPALRNRLRSAAAHNTISVPGREPNSWLDGRWGLFAMKDKSNARLGLIDGHQVEATHTGFGAPVRRRIEVSERQVTVLDTVPAELSSAVVRLVLAPDVVAIREDGGFRLRFMDNVDPGLVLRLPDRWTEESVTWSAGYGYIAQTVGLSGPPGQIAIISQA
jgi:hypothetical protein